MARILETPESLSLQGEKKIVSVLFSDIRDFTALSETLAPDVLVSHLNKYFSAMVEAVQKQNGMVDKFIGDGLLAVFGAPLPVPNSAQSAVEAARSMIVRLQAVNAEFAREGIGPIRIGIGIHTGEALVGNIGSDRKMEYTVIGDVVNTTSRIEGLNKTHNAHRSGILISGDTLAALNGQVPVEFIGEELMKGKTRKVAVYQVELAG
ncbi:MAG: adenylate/guanylate cyclase domain-containing protein [Acidobacteriota bacterium]